MTTPGDIQPMKLESVELNDVGRYVVDDDWVAEQKCDGVRILARIGSGRLDFVSFGGMHVKHAASVLHFPRLREELAMFVESGVEFVFDGELLNSGEYWVYDLPLALPHFTPEENFGMRRAGLEAMFDAWPEGTRPSIHLLPQAKTPDEKEALFVRIIQAGCEGLVLKDVRAKYEVGRRVRHQLKAKLVKTCDAVVIARNTGKPPGCNARLAVYDDDGSLRPIGGCSMIGKEHDAPIPVGSVVEVRYLYFTGESLYQPTVLRLRTDKAAEDCNMGQFVTVSKEVVR